MNDNLAESESTAMSSSDNPVCATILAAIIRAKSATDLHRIAKEEISPGKDMSENERLLLWDALSKKFSALNAAAMGDKIKPRWG